MKFPMFPRIVLDRDLDALDKALAKQGNKLKPYRYDGPVGTKGRWKIEQFKIEAGLAQLRYVRDGGRGMAPGKYHRLIRDNNTLVMSDTDAEMIDFLDSVRGIEGHVLIGGLGMGLAIKALLLTKVVTSITVVELDQDVIDLVGGHYDDGRVGIVQGDIFEWVPPKDARYDWAWFDIWDTISDENVPEMNKLRRRYASNMTGTGHTRCWAEYECKQMSKGVDARNWY